MLPVLWGGDDLVDSFEGGASRGDLAGVVADLIERLHVLAGIGEESGQPPDFQRCPPKAPISDEVDSGEGHRGIDEGIDEARHGVDPAGGEKGAEARFPEFLVRFLAVLVPRPF
jgi:hypothetical protein